MFLEIAIGAIAVGIILMVGYVVVSMVQGAMPTPTLANGSTDVTAVAGISSAKTTVYAGFGLLAVGVVVLAAYGLIAVFK